MNAANPEAAMAKKKGRPPKPTGEGTLARIDTDIIFKARYIVAKRKITLAKYLSDLLRPVIERDFRKESKELLDSDR